MKNFYVVGIHSRSLHPTISTNVEFILLKNNRYVLRSLACKVKSTMSYAPLLNSFTGYDVETVLQVLKVVSS